LLSRLKRAPQMMRRAPPRGPRPPESRGRGGAGPTRRGCLPPGQSQHSCVQRLSREGELIDVAGALGAPCWRAAVRVCACRVHARARDARMEMRAPRPPLRDNRWCALYCAGACVCVCACVWFVAAPRWCAGAPRPPRAAWAHAVGSADGSTSESDSTDAPSDALSSSDAEDAVSVVAVSQPPPTEEAAPSVLFLPPPLADVAVVSW
jgi:hypothetical protein